MPNTGHEDLNIIMTERVTSVCNFIHHGNSFQLWFQTEYRRSRLEPASTQSWHRGTIHQATTNNPIRFIRFVQLVNDKTQIAGTRIYLVLNAHKSPAPEPPQFSGNKTRGFTFRQGSWHFSLHSRVKPPIRYEFLHFLGHGRFNNGSDGQRSINEQPLRG